MNEDGTERLAKVLAAHGVASRREAEAMIAAGRVSVNGNVSVHPGQPVNERKDAIRVDDKPMPAAPRLVYYVLYKPKGYIVTRADPNARKSVMELMPELPERVEPVGRLDINTEGALLLTNDGELAHRLTHPSAGVPKRYLAKVYRTPTDKTIARLEAGIQLEDGKTAPAKVRLISATDAENAWIEITVTEGRNRLIRRMFATVGHPVSKLVRQSFATVTIRGLERGSFRALGADEVERLREIGEGTPAASAGRRPNQKKDGFAKADPKWLERRLEGKKKRMGKRTG
ncbi:pseudouridine synthase [Deltaproteobacteria bacterium]|nr:pseudouridine synthase [Deltaproteobacteria bacterium]